MLALTINGERPLRDHGFPARIIAPNRPGGAAGKVGQGIDDVGLNRTDGVGMTRLRIGLGAAGVLLGLVGSGLS